MLLFLFGDVPEHVFALVGAVEMALLVAMIDMRGGRCGCRLEEQLMVLGKGTQQTTGPLPREAT